MNLSNGHQQRMKPDEFNAIAQRLDELVQEFEALPYPAVKEKVFEALQAIDTIHREAVGRLITLLCEPEHTELLGRAVKDPFIHTLLVLYDLIDSSDLPLEPTPEATRNFVPLEQLAPVKRRLNQPVFTDVARVADVPVGSMKNFQVDGASVLIANVAGEMHAVRDICHGGARRCGLR